MTEITLEIEFGSFEGMDTPDRQALLSALALFLREVSGSPTAIEYRNAVLADLRRVLSLLYSCDGAMGLLR